MTIEKLISSKDEILFWKHRYEKAELSPFLEKELKENKDPLSSKKAFKIGQTKQTSWLNISELLKDFRFYLDSKDLLIKDTFDFNNLHQNGQYETFHFDKVVFCEGAAATKNPFFDRLPFSLNKGQILTIKTAELPQNKILKKSVFILPVEKHTFKVGASYSWKWDHENADEEKTNWLKEQISFISDCSYKVEKVEAGIRPAVKDRRPLMGASPIRKNVYIFNGLGSRGCLMAPLLAEELYQHMEHSRPLDKEANINRFNRD